jgi:GNAT superfamily N-acetyltransferase
VWQQRTLAGSEGTSQATFLLVEGDHTAGLVTGLRQPPDEVLLVGMWVDPENRRAGHGERLVRELVGWAEQTGVTRVLLE